MSPDEIIQLLDLRPHPTCGFTRETFLSRALVPASVLGGDYESARHLGGVLYFLITRESPVRCHRIRSDQMYHFYLGDPLDVLLLGPGSVTVQRLGTDLARGMRPQLLVPGGTFHTAQISPGGSFALLGTSVWARAEPTDVEQGDLQSLLKAVIASQPQVASEVVRFWKAPTS
jgi:predicted cupin superfamily sugar epimerase